MTKPLGGTVELNRDDFEWLIAEARYAQRSHSALVADMARVDLIEQLGRQP